jgi:hypothetical protein
MNVSAIVSAYYARDFIRARLDNLMEQSPRPEIIVVAQLGSLEAAIAKTYDVTWILTPGIPTIYAAWNMAIKASNCEFITNANCDDLTYRGSYAAMAKMLHFLPDYWVIYGNEGQTTDGKLAHIKLRPQGDFELLKKQCFVGPMPMWRKSLHEIHGYFREDLKVCGDYEFWLRIASKGAKLKHIDKIVGLYRNRPESAEHRQPDIAQSEKEFVQMIYEDAEIST